MTRVPDDFVPPVPDRWIDVTSPGGLRLTAQVHGPTGPDGVPTVLLSHGWTLSARYWSRVIRRLRAELRVVGYDQRGHGLSGHVPPGGFCTDALADDLAAVLAATVPAGRRAVLVGHSMGAMSVLAFGDRHPEMLRRRVSGAVLIDTGVDQLLARARIGPSRRAPRPSTDDPTEPTEPTNPTDDVIDPTDEASSETPMHRLAVALSRRGLTRPGLLRALPPAVLRGIVTHTTLSPAASAAERSWTAEVVAACPPETAAGFAAMLGDLDLAEAVPRLDVPTLVLVGDADRLTPPWHARRLAAALPNCLGLITLPGVGHMAPLQAPDAIADAVRRVVAVG